MSHWLNRWRMKNVPRPPEAQRLQTPRPRIPLRLCGESQRHAFSVEIPCLITPLRRGLLAALVFRTLLLAVSISLLAAQAADEPWTETTMRTPRNSHTLTLLADCRALAAHQVLADWTDSQTNQTQRQTGVNWQTIGLGSGSDCAAEAAGTADLASAGGAWIDLDVKALAQAWAANPADNQGLVLLQAAASGAVTYSFCSELGWSPCTAAQAPQLTIWCH